MSQYNDPGKLEEAMAEVVGGLTLNVYDGDSPATTVTVTTGQDDDDLPLPSVVCSVVGAGEQVVLHSGVYRTPVVVRVTSSAKVTLAEHRARAATVFDGFLQSDIASTLAAAVDDFHCYDVFHRAPEPTRKEPRGDDAFVFVTEMNMDVVWCGSDIS